MRHRVTIEIMVDADSTNEALAKGQKLCDVLNSKDPRNKARVPKIVVNPKDKS